MIKNIGILRCQKLEQICPMADCLEAYHTRTGKFGEVLAEKGDVTFRLAGIATCGGCGVNKKGAAAVKRVENMINHGIEIVFLSSCMVRGEFFPKDLETGSVEETERTIRTCLFTTDDPHADRMAHEVACQVCAGHLEAECPHELDKVLHQHFDGQVELRDGTHFEHLSSRQLAEDLVQPNTKRKNAG